MPWIELGFGPFDLFGRRRFCSKTTQIDQKITDGETISSKWPYLVMLWRSRCPSKSEHAIYLVSLWTLHYSDGVETVLRSPINRPILVLTAGRLQ